MTAIKNKQNLSTNRLTSVTIKKINLKFNQDFFNVMNDISGQTSDQDLLHLVLIYTCMYNVHTHTHTHTHTYTHTHTHQLQIFGKIVF